MSNLWVEPVFATGIAARTLGGTERGGAVAPHRDSCAQAFEIVTDPTVSSERRAKEAAAIQAGKHFFYYFEVMRWNLKERDYLLDLIEQALIAKEGVLIMGPPGTAKSQVADTVLGGIIDEGKVKEKQNLIAKAMAESEEASLAAGSPTESSKKSSKKKKKVKDQKTVAELQNEPVNSFFRLQLTAETTMSETHGPLNFKKLTEENIYDRKYEDSMLNFKNVFIDEIFDARPNALRNILGILGERAHSQGGRTRKAKLETFIAATNSYLSQVYEKAGNDGPKAVIDRFSFSSFVPGELEKTKSAVTLIQGAKNEAAQKEIPRLTFQELDQIRELVPDVDIPVHVASFLAVLSKQISEETKTLEDASLKQHDNALRNGDAAPPPYRASKYHSPCSLGKAAGILKAWVVRDWLKQQLDPTLGYKRQLKATLEDVKALEQFFTLNGPSDDFLKKLISRATNEDEKAQLEAIERERTVFRKRYEDLFKPVEERFRGHVEKYFDEVHGATTPETKKTVAQKLAVQWAHEVEPHLPKSDNLSELDGNAIGALKLDEVLSQFGIALVGDTEWENLTKFAKEKRQVAEVPLPEPDMRQSEMTTIGAKYILEPNHQKLGKAWEDERGLFWSDQAVRDSEGNVKKMNWDQAKDYCFGLNKDPQQRARVETRFNEREKMLEPIRNEYEYLPVLEKRTGARISVRYASQEFGPIRGCYLPNREELEELGVDMGFADSPDNQFKGQILSDLSKTDTYWTSSRNTTGWGDALRYNWGADDGGVDGAGRFDHPFLVRCVCSPVLLHGGI